MNANLWVAAGLGAVAVVYVSAFVWWCLRDAPTDGDDYAGDSR